MPSQRASSPASGAGGSQPSLMSRFLAGDSGAPSSNLRGALKGSRAAAAVAEPGADISGNVPDEEFREAKRSARVMVAQMNFRPHLVDRIVEQQTKEILERRGYAVRSPRARTPREGDVTLPSKEQLVAAAKQANAALAMLAQQPLSEARAAQEFKLKSHLQQLNAAYNQLQAQGS